MEMLIHLHLSPENMTKDSKHDLIATERQKALLEASIPRRNVIHFTVDSKYNTQVYLIVVLPINVCSHTRQLSLTVKTSEISKMDMAIEREEKRVKQLEQVLERENLKFEEFLKDNEKKSVEARTLYVCPRFTHELLQTDGMIPQLNLLFLGFSLWQFWTRSQVQTAEERRDQETDHWNSHNQKVPHLLWCNISRMGLSSNPD